MNAAKRSNETRDVTLVEAVNMALHRAMADDENVVVLGEDIATNGGVFRATVGLKEAFGFKRVMDTPLAENLIAGTTIGMATQGLKPVAEFQFMGFIYAGMEQIVSHAARMRNRTRGRLHCPLVFRAPFGTTGLWPAAGGHPQSGPGDFSGAQTYLPGSDPERGGQRRGAAAGYLLHPARRR